MREGPRTGARLKAENGDNEQPLASNNLAVLQALPKETSAPSHVERSLVNWFRRENADTAVIVNSGCWLNCNRFRRTRSA